jgi:hypothetical protein
MLRIEEKEMNPFKAAQNFWEFRSAWLGDGGQPVSYDQAQARANVCLQCPMNEEMGLYEGLAKHEADKLKKQIELKNSMALRVDGEKRLHICKACLCVLRLKVWAQMKHIKDTTDIDKLDEKCWIRDEMKQ